MEEAKRIVLDQDWRSPHIRLQHKQRTNEIHDQPWIQSLLDALVA